MKLDLSNYYVLCNTKDKIVEGTMSELPENWGGIFSVPSLSDEELYDFGWFDKPGQGWVRIDNLKGFSCTPETLENNKERLRRLGKETRENIEQQGIVWDGVRFELDSETILFNNFQRSRGQNIMKNSLGYHRVKNYIEFVDKMNAELDTLIENDIEFSRQIDKSKTIHDLIKVTYDN